jgi:pimeloyl-ACP methyl ester carboxylesterase
MGATWEWRGYHIFVAEQGDGPPVLLVHGVYAGASSYEFRIIAPLLALRHRVVAFDFLGCGASEKPRVDYRAELFVDQVVDAVDRVQAPAVTIVASSLGAAFAIRAAARLGPRVAALVVICPTGIPGVLDGGAVGARRVAETLLYAPVTGPLLYRALVSRASIRWFLERQAYGDKRDVTPEIVEHYYGVAHTPGARWVPSAFVSGRLDCAISDDLPRVTAPLLILWGARAPSENPVRNALAFERLARSAQCELFARSAYLPHEQEPGAVDASIEGFLRARFSDGQRQGRERS